MGTTQYSFFNKILTLNFHWHLWIQHEKCLQLSSNKCSISSFVSWIAAVIWENIKLTKPVTSMESIRPRALAHIAQKVDIVRNKLIFSGEVHECVLNHWLKVPENPPCRFFKIQDGVQNGPHFPSYIITLPPDVLETWIKCLNICFKIQRI